MNSPRIHYELSVADMAAKHFAITQRIDDCAGGAIRLRMADWVPGSYVMRDYARHVVGFTARSGKQTLAFEKLDKSTWEIALQGATSCEIHYEVYADELSVRTNDITDEHAFAHPAACFLCVEGREDEAHEIKIDAPRGFKVHGALPHGAHGSFVAADYDALVDSPFELCKAPAHEFMAGGKKHRFVIAGDGNFDIDRILEDTAKICSTEVELFGELPAEDYLFILLLTKSGGGGLEHCHSSVLAWPKLGFRPAKEYRKFLTLVAHEYFHLWNVKRIKPETFLRFDYQKEMHTRLLWVFEGITSYYDQLIPLRAGVFQPKDYFELLCERLVAERSRGGRHIQSLQESSFDTWTRFYRPTPDSYNSQVSYYERGELVALLLDQHLRKQSGDTKSLDDVMRYLYHGIAKKGAGLAEDGFGAAVLAATGIEVEAFLKRFVEGLGDLDYGDAFTRMGLKLIPSESEEERAQAWLGAVIESAPGTSKLGHVARDGSAHGGGLMAGDEIVALDGHLVRDDLEARLKLYKTGETVRWTASRRDRLVEGVLTFLENPNPPQKMVTVAELSSAQKTAFKKWSGTDLELG
jgi:predicted metalloprotease with PDZ domain